MARSISEEVELGDHLHLDFAKVARFSESLCEDISRTPVERHFPYLKSAKEDLFHYGMCKRLLNAKCGFDTEDGGKWSSIDDGENALPVSTEFLPPLINSPLRSGEEEGESREL